jgi:orotidine-5'-phosphate decarboxylase
MNNIYLALDFPTWAETSKFIEQHDLEGAPVKVGMELFYREGPDVIKRLKENNHSIFLDLKLYDIPTTVHKAMKNLANLEVDIVNVHALGGSEMIKQAKEGLLSGNNNKTKLIAVTILTSFDNKTINNELRLQGNLTDNAVHLAKLTKNSGADGVVCSVHEAGLIKDTCGSQFLTVTPGIRLQDSDHDDQKRIATPQFARKHGADLLVIGRSITNAENPQHAYRQAIKEWNNEI